jgi:outer membrane protein OmpA-like peptidoglycan-associated protein
VNALALLSGARPIDSRGEAVDVGGALFDGAPQAWEVRAGDPLTLLVQLAEPFDLAQVEVINSHDEAGYPGIGVKRLRLETAARQEGPWALLAELELKTGTRPQGQAVAAKAVRWVRITALKNHGNAEWTAMDELRLWGTRSAPRAQVRFAGTWETRYGEMVLSQEGQRVWGCYGGEGTDAGLYTVEGSVEGPVFSGTWREANSAAPDAAGSQGTLAFTLTSEGELSGVYGNYTGNRDARWDGTPKARTTITCRKPEADLGERLAKSGRVVLQGLLFDTGKDTLKPESEAVLQALAKALKGKAGAYTLEGHTDDRGGQAFNQGLSERRAATVKAWLVKAGVSPSILTPRGLGMSKPVLPNDTEAGRAANRRVEVVSADGAQEE